MQFGLYVTQPNALAGSPAIAESRDNALSSLPPHAVDAQFSLGYDVLLEADRLGFDLILFAERHLGPDISAWIMASAIGAQAKRLRSLVAVHPGLWHPAMIAKLMTSLDRICPGRSAINIVTGWNEREFRMYGGEVLLDDDVRRYARAKEFIDIIRGLCRNTPYSYSGEFYKLDGTELLLKPATPEPPEIFTAARTEAGLEMVAQTADWWFLDYPKTSANVAEVEEALRTKMEDMIRRAARHGRKIRFAFNPFIAFGTSVESAMEQTLDRLLEFEPGADTRLMKSRLGPPMKAGGIGPAAQVRDQMKRYSDMGIELLLLKFIPTVENVRRIAEEIIAPMRAPG
jgi:FMNH2-dependent dimethyl sulfone monooxygenase